MSNEKPKPALPEWMHDAIRAEPPGFMQDLVQASRQRSNSASMIPPARRSEDAPRPASGGTAPLREPAGLRWVDAQLDAADRDARAAAIRQRVETQLIEKLTDDEARSK
jgi:hypothetical protein